MMQYFYSNFSDLIVPEEVIGQSFEKRDIKMYCLTKRSKTNIVKLYFLPYAKDGNTTFDQEAANKTIAYITCKQYARQFMNEYSTASPKRAYVTIYGYLLYVQNTC